LARYVRVNPLSATLNLNNMFGGGGFQAQAHQANKQNLEMLKKHKKDKKQFLSGIDRLESNNSEQDSTALTNELRSHILRELEAKKRRHKILTTVISTIIFGAMFVATLLIIFSRVTRSF